MKIEKFMHKIVLLLVLIIYSSSVSAKDVEYPSWEIDSESSSVYLNSKTKINYIPRDYLIALQNEPSSNSLRLLLSVNDVNDATHRVINRITDFVSQSETKKLVMHFRFWSQAKGEIEGFANVDYVSRDLKKKLTFFMSFLDPDAANFVLREVSASMGSFSFELYTLNNEIMLPVKKITSPLYPGLSYSLGAIGVSNETHHISKESLNWTFIRFKNGWLHRGKLNNSISKIFKGTKSYDKRALENTLLANRSEIKNYLTQCWLGDGDVGFEDNEEGIEKAAKAHFGETGMSPNSKSNFSLSEKIIEAAKNDDFTVIRNLMSSYINAEYSLAFFDDIKRFSDIFTEDQIAEISESEPRCAPSKNMWSRYDNWKDHAMPVGNIWIRDGRVVGITNVSKPDEQNSYQGIPESSTIYKLLN